MPRFTLKCDTCDNDCDIKINGYIVETQCSVCISKQINKRCVECDKVIMFPKGRINIRKKYCSRKCERIQYVRRKIEKRKQAELEKRKSAKKLRPTKYPRKDCMVCGKPTIKAKYLKLKKRCRDCNNHLKNMV